MTKINFKNNKTKITTAIISALAVGIIMLLPLTTFPTVNAQTTPSQNHPLPPNAVGCYVYTPSTGWATTQCAAEDQLKSIRKNHPSEGDGSTYGVYGLRASGTTVNFGETDVKFSAYTSPENDLTYGTNYWSIQTNTNFFSGSNGLTDWDQFVYQNDPGNSSQNDICIWQITGANTKNPNFNNIHCVGTNLPPAQTLSSSYEAYTYGYYNSSNLTGEFCTYSPSFKCWSVVTADSYGLGSHWTDTSGTILGLANGSIADFTHTTTETTTVTSDPESSASGYTDGNAAEQNNLSYSSTSTACSPTCTATSSSTK